MIKISGLNYAMHASNRPSDKSRSSQDSEKEVKTLCQVKIMEKNQKVKIIKIKLRWKIKILKKVDLKRIIL